MIQRDGWNFTKQVCFTLRRIPSMHLAVTSEVSEPIMAQLPTKRDSILSRGTIIEDQRILVSKSRIVTLVQGLDSAARMGARKSLVYKVPPRYQTILNVLGVSSTLHKVQRPLASMMGITKVHDRNCCSEGRLLHERK